MPLKNDGDVVRGLGFVALYAAYLEEQIDNLLFRLEPIEPFPEIEQRWPTSRKIEKAKRLVTGLQFDYRDDLLADLETSRQLLQWRNEVIHGRIYANFNRTDTLRSGRRNTPDRVVKPDELYDLANALIKVQAAILRPMIFQLSQAMPSIP
ncbi:hypothetical protein [Uliginosibacterium gangwonense]|uniref:hypothetical protein n=1 Tax=Uliginosibacterium gangwonense TaxID=392736 RepID=UPI000376C69A|nr:hypothetical protein [Uliginosibacterium gangwonense]